jgi:hypothetical protein
MESTKNNIKPKVGMEWLKLCKIQLHSRWKVVVMLLKPSCYIDCLSNIDSSSWYICDYVHVVYIMIH